MVAKKKSAPYVVRGHAGAVFEMDELSPAIERQLKRGECVLVEGPAPADAASDDAPATD
jgi:hypothetical protein